MPVRDPSAQISREAALQISASMQGRPIQRDEFSSAVTVDEARRRQMQAAAIGGDIGKAITYARERRMLYEQLKAAGVGGDIGAAITYQKAKRMEYQQILAAGVGGDISKAITYSIKQRQLYQQLQAAAIGGDIGKAITYQREQMNLYRQLQAAGIGGDIGAAITFQREQLMQYKQLQAAAVGSDISKAFTYQYTQAQLYRQIQAAGIGGDISKAITYQRKQLMQYKQLQAAAIGEDISKALTFQREPTLTLSPDEQAYLDMVYGPLPPASHFGPPSGFTTLPSISPSYEDIAPPTVKIPHGAEYTAGAEKPFSEKGLSELIGLPAGYTIVGAEKFTLGPLGAESGTRISALAEAYSVTLEPLHTVAPSGLELLSKSKTPLISGFAEDIMGAEAIKKTPVEYITKKVLYIGGTAATLVMPATALLYAGTGVGISQGIKAVQGGGWLTIEELKLTAASSALFAVGSASVAMGTATVFAGRTLSGIVARTVSNAALGGGIGYLASGGDVEAAKFGFVLGAGATLGVELGTRAVSYLRAYLPKRLGGVERLTRGPQVVGKSGELVDTYLSKPIDVLGGKRLEVVADVTKAPIGYRGVTLKSMISEYVGERVPTGHATLSPSSFELSVGGKTVLKGVSSEAMGFRSAEQLFHFYSAAGSEEFVTVYGGYMGIGAAYSETPKIVFGGKPTALVTTDTFVSPEFLKQAGESVDDYLARVSGLSGKTGLAPETIIGASAERQLVTPAQYERFGVQLAGSMYVSEGKVGVFQVMQQPTGLLGKIPVVRELLSEYTAFTVYKGSFAPVKGVIPAVSKMLDVQGYGASYGRIISLSRFTVMPSVISTVAVTAPKIASLPSTKTIYKSIPSVPSRSVLIETISSPSKAPSTYYTSFIKQSPMVSSALRISYIKSFKSLHKPLSSTLKFSSLPKPLTSILKSPTVKSKPLSMPSIPKTSIPTITLPSMPSEVKSFPSLPAPSLPTKPSVPSKIPIIPLTTSISKTEFYPSHAPSIPPLSPPIISPPTEYPRYSPPSYQPPSTPSYPSPPSPPSYPSTTVKFPPIINEEIDRFKAKGVRNLFISGFGRYKREYPIATAKEVLGFVLNNKKRSKRK